MVPLERGTDGGAESLDLAEVDPTSEAGLQHEAGLLHADRREGSTRPDLHGDVHVAVGTPVIARQRAEQREPPDAAGLKVGPAGTQALDHPVPFRAHRKPPFHHPGSDGRGASKRRQPFATDA
jgi:hypothetical protein